MPGQSYVLLPDLIQIDVCKGRTAFFPSLVCFQKRKIKMIYRLTCIYGFFSNLVQCFKEIFTEDRGGGEVQADSMWSLWWWIFFLNNSFEKGFKASIVFLTFC